MLPEFDTSKFYLGVLCLRKHDWQGTGQSLRYHSKGCAECARKRAEKRLQEKPISYRQKQAIAEQVRIEQANRKEIEARHNIDTTNFYLGKLCSSDHDFQETGYSLRYANSTKCVECRRIKSRAKSKAFFAPNIAKKQAIKAHQKELEIIHGVDTSRYRVGNLCSSGHDWNNTGYSLRRANAYRCVVCDAEWRLNNPESGFNARKRYKLRQAEIRRTLPCKRAEPCKTALEKRLRAGRRAHQRRARKRKVLTVSFSVEELENHVAKFNGECAYCKSTEKLTIDHFISLNKGGSECLGNQAVCCWSCNCSKSDSDPLEWFKKQPFFSKKQWIRVLSILGKTEKTYDQIPLF
jgi:5-methylcytosine-specific restriction endonuclease McrA